MEEIGMKKKQQRWKRAGALTLAVLLGCMAPGTVFGAEIDGLTPEKEARLNDNQIEYDEWFDLLKYKYGPMRSAYKQLEQSLDNSSTITIETSLMADDLMRQADELEDSMAGLPQEQKAALRTQINLLRATARSTRNSLFFSNQQMDSTRESSLRTLDRSTNGIVYQVEGLMNQYQQLLSQRQIAAKSVELSQKARDLRVQMEAQGMAVGADVLSAATQLSSAQDQLKALDDAIASMRDSLFSFAGASADQNPQIGAVPAADPAAVAAIDFAGDIEKAVNNNYNIISLRSSNTSAQGLMEQQFLKSTTDKKNRLRNLEYAENQVRSNVQTLYDDVMEKKTLYDSASTAWQSAQNTWNAVQVQRQTGMLSDVQYLQQELAYLQAKSQMECADLNLQQSMRSYEWAVKGVEVTAQ